MIPFTCLCTTLLLLLLLAHLMWCPATALHTPAWHRRPL